MVSDVKEGHVGYSFGKDALIYKIKCLCIARGILRRPDGDVPVTGSADGRHGELHLRIAPRTDGHGRCVQADFPLRRAEAVAVHGYAVSPGARAGTRG